VAKRLDELTRWRRRDLAGEIRLEKRTYAQLAKKYGLPISAVERLGRKIRGHQSANKRKDALAAQASAPVHCGRQLRFKADRLGYITEHCTECSYKRMYR